MELTTSYQKLGEAYLGSSAGDLYIRIYAKYSEQDVSNNRSKVQYQARAYFSGSYIYDQQSSGNVKGTSANQVNFSKSDSYSNGETPLATTEAWVTHNTDGTMTISASAYLRFPNWGWSNTASGTATLPNLHKPPEFETAEMEETNATMLALNIPDTTIVRHLSQKQITLHGFTYDEATLTYRLEHFGTTYNIPATGYQVSNVFDTDYRSNDITIDSNNKASIVQKLADSLNGTATDWLYIDIAGTIQKPDAIPYAKPSLVGTSTTIKRKSGNGTNLTDNKANLNLVGTIYKANDIVGNDNAITQIGYKIWEDGTSEPANYTSLTPTISGNDVTVTNYEISNVDFTKIYNYKIKVADKYYDYEIEGIVPLGQATWTEYKDRVDFLKITQQGNEVLTEGDVLYEGYLEGGNNTSIDMTNYSRLRIYAVSYSTQFFFDLDLTEAVSLPLTSGRSYVASGVGSYYSTSQSALEYHMCCVEVNDAKTALYNTTMGYLRGSTTNLRNNNSDYYIYKIVGYK